MCSTVYDIQKIFAILSMKIATSINHFSIVIIL